MQLETKKYLVYGGLAVIVGSIGYIVYSSIFVKKPIVNKDETVDSVTETPYKTTFFADLLEQTKSMPTSIFGGGIK